MSHFTEAEIAYMNAPHLGRLATTSSDGPHVVPVSYRYSKDTDTIEIRGRNFGKSKKFHDMQADPRVAFVIDDVSDASQPRGIEIRGTVQIVQPDMTSKSGHSEPAIKITPTKIVSWGIESDSYKQNSRKVG